MYYLFRAISESLYWNKTYRKLSLCSNERTCPDYSFGPIDSLLRKHNVDAILLVFGQNELETEARASARHRSRSVAFVSSFSPVRLAPLRNPGTYLSMALIDHTGSVLWYTSIMSGKGFDFRDPAKIEELTKKMLDRVRVEE